MTAVSTKPVFFQWQKQDGYPVFLRMGRELLEGRLQKLITDLGFVEIAEADHKKISASRPGTKVITVSRASTRVAQQVMLPDSMDRYGHENLSYRGETQIYLYRRIGMMVSSPTSTLWELGLVSSLDTTEELTGLRVMLNRALAWALAPMGVLGFWGVATSEGLVAMKQSQSFGEVVFVDVDKLKMYSSSGTTSIASQFTILRADKPGPVGRALSPEELVSYLNTTNIYFSHIGLPHTLKRSALKLGATVRGEWSGVTAPVAGLSNA